jgi:RNAse (barnase) inhibitor barstar
MSKPTEILLDVSSIEGREALHDLLASTFNFPDYYGKNWDAFDECIRDYPPSAPVRIKGVQKLENALPREAALLRHCFRTFEAELPSKRILYVS